MQNAKFCKERPLSRNDSVRVHQFVSDMVVSLKQCRKLRDLEQGRRLHAEAVAAGVDTNKYVAAFLVSMYSRCREMPLAREVFEEMSHRDVVAWNSLILGYVENGEFRLAMTLFTCMDCEPSSLTFVAALKACGGMAGETAVGKEACLEQGMELHKRIKERGFDTEQMVANTLIAMYSKCGSMACARTVFDRMRNKNVVSWTSLILGYVGNGECELAIKLFGCMNSEPDSLTYVAVVKACQGLADGDDESKLKLGLLEGSHIHRQVEDLGLASDVLVANALIVMYKKFRRVDNARDVFDKLESRDAITWNSLILAYVENAMSSVALDLFTAMDCEPSSVTYLAVLKACAGLAVEEGIAKEFCLERGIVVHKQLKTVHLDCQLSVGNALVDMYAKLGSLTHAKAMFGVMTVRNIVTWTSFIFGYLENGKSFAAMDLISTMECEPDPFAYVAMLKACGCLLVEEELNRHFCLEKGIDIHNRVKAIGLDCDNIVVATTLLEFYSLWGCMQRARSVFDGMARRTVVVWTSLILAYVRNGQSMVALDLFKSMDCEPTSVTYVAAIKACGEMADRRKLGKSFCLDKGMSLHKSLVSCGHLLDTVTSTALVDMYSKCGSMRHARQVFDGMIHRNIITWNSLLLGYVNNCEASIALELLGHMDCQPDSFTYVAALKASSELVSENAVRKEFCVERIISLHKQLRDSGLDSDMVVMNTLVERYGRLGCCHMSKEIYDRSAKRNVVTWTLLMEGYLASGDYFRAMSLLDSLDCEPDLLALLVALKACGGVACVKESEKQSCLVKGMMIHKTVHSLGFEADVVMATALMEMYSKCGDMQRAKEMFDGMSKPDLVACNTLMWGYVENGENQRALELFTVVASEPNSHTYSAALKACTSLAALPAGRKIHARVCRVGVEDDRVVATSLVELYGKCGCMNRAEELFTSITSPGIIAWTVLIAGYCSVGNSCKVFGLVKEMEEEGIHMDAITFTCVLTACSQAGLVDRGKRYFDTMVSRYGIMPSVEHYTCMVEVLGKANRVEEALSAVKNLPKDMSTSVFKALLVSCKNNVKLE